VQSTRRSYCLSVVLYRYSLDVVRVYSNRTTSYSICWDYIGNTGWSVLLLIVNLTLVLNLVLTLHKSTWAIRTIHDHSTWTVRSIRYHSRWTTSHSIPWYYFRIVRLIYVLILAVNLHRFTWTIHKNCGSRYRRRASRSLPLQISYLTFVWIVKFESILAS
jgi:hypothetical protein